MQSEEQARAEVEKINQYMTSQPWCDFEVMSYLGERLTIMGSLDPSHEHEIEIVFEGVACASLPFEWKTDTSVSPFQLVTGEHAVRLNRIFQVEVGHRMFGIRPEGYSPGFLCVVAARRIGFRVVTGGPVADMNT